jgi:hypothetical protein
MQSACTALGFWESALKSYSIRVSSGCVGNTQHLNISARFTYALDGTTSSDETGWVGPLANGAPQPPDPPTNVRAVAGDQRVTVSWSAPVTHGSPVTGYILYYGNEWRSVGLNTSVTIQGLTNGVPYKFSVVAISNAGDSARSAESNTVIPHVKPGQTGYWMLGANARVYPFGNARTFLANYFFGVRRTVSTGVAIAGLRSGSGYWILAEDGGVSAHGNAQWSGERPALQFGERLTSISGSPTGKGYWLFTNRGRAFAYGDAMHFGDMSGVPLNGAIVASAATPTGRGYYMVGSDGGIFAFGDARFHGSMGGKRLNKPVVGIAPTPDNRGYWLVGSDGGVFAFNAPFRGSLGSVHLNKPVNGLVAFGNGYLMVASDGGVFAFSNKPFLGSLGASPPSAPIVGIAAFAT